MHKGQGDIDTLLLLALLLATAAVTSYMALKTASLTGVSVSKLITKTASTGAQQGLKTWVISSGGGLFK